MAVSLVAASLALAAGLLALAFAAILRTTRHDSEAARALAIVLMLEGVLQAGAGLPPLIEGVALPLARVADAGFLAAMIAAPSAYLLLLRELPSPLTEPWRRGALGARLRMLVPLVGGPAVLLALLAPAACFYLGVLGLLAINGYALAAAIDARRRTMPKSVLRARANAFLVAFGTRDLAFVIAAVVSIALSRGGFALVAAAVGTLLYVPLLIAAIARTDLFLLAPVARARLDVLKRFADARRIGPATWEARDARERHVILKRLASHDIANALTTIKSTKLPRLTEAWTGEGGTWGAFARVDGTPLKDEIRRCAFAAGAALSLAHDLCEGLSSLHSAGLVHADVKPSNVLIQPNGGAVLIDLGSARLASDPAGAPGTARYLAPEVARGDVATPASDVYSAALCVWEAMTGTPYVEHGGDALDARVRAAHPGPYRPPATAPDDLRDWLRGALAEDPLARFDDGEAARASLPQRS